MAFVSIIHRIHRGSSWIQTHPFLVVHRDSHNQLVCHRGQELELHQLIPSSVARNSNVR